MNTLNKLILIFALASGAVQAQEKGCIELRTDALTEQTVVGPDGKPQVKLVTAATVVPGTDVIWTITATNICPKPAGDVAIDSPVPEHMAYVANSASNGAFKVTFSLDGKQYAEPDALTVREADGAIRPARADEYRHLRYAMVTPLAPGKAVSATYRTIVE